MLGMQLIGGTVSEALKQKVGYKQELKDQ